MPPDGGPPDAGPRAPLAAGNDRLARLTRLARRRRDRERSGRFLLEGPRPIDHALDLGAPLEAVFAEAGCYPEILARARSSGVETFEVSPGALDKVLTTVTPQPVVAVAPMPEVPGALDVDLTSGAGPVVLVAGMGDPGNAGTLVRSAAAAGATAVVFAGGAVDPWSPKVVRSSAGTILDLPVRRLPDEAGLARALEDLRAAGVRRVGAVAAGGRPPDEADLGSPLALVLGSEAHGLPPAVRENLDDVVTVPMAGTAESLNVGVAGAVLLFEAARQRRGSDRAEAAMQVVSAVSHELRSPLTAVKGFTTALLRRWEALDDGRRRSMLGDVVREADRVSRLVTELLEVSRLETGRLRLEPHYLDVASLLEEAVALARADQPELRCSLELAADLPRVVGDPARLRAVVANLLENAAKYGGGVAAVRVEEVAGRVAIEVVDEGPGLDEAEVAAAFTRGARRERPSGSGLGLWLGREVVRAHGGSLELRADRAGGLVARLELPAEEPPG